VRRGGLWAKHMGLKPGAIRNTRGEHSGNIFEPIGNKEKLDFFFIKKPENFCRKIVMKKKCGHIWNSFY
jgi:hypothetical protein